MKKIITVLFIAFLTFSCNNKPASKKVETNKKENVVKKSNEIAIILNSNDQMQFDKKVLSASPGQSITLTLNHTGRGNKMIMGHNFVLLKKDVDVDVFAGLIGGGESITITFDAPKQGVYNFICSFPAHYQLMRGQLIVK